MARSFWYYETNTFYDSYVPHDFTTIAHSHDFLSYYLYFGGHKLGECVTCPDSFVPNRSVIRPLVIPLFLTPFCSSTTKFAFVRLARVLFAFQHHFPNMVDTHSYHSMVSHAPQFWQQLQAVDTIGMVDGRAAASASTSRLAAVCLSPVLYHNGAAAEVILQWSEVATPN